MTASPSAIFGTASGLTKLVGFDAGMAGGDQPFDELDFLCCAEIGGIGLQSIPGGNLDDLDGLGHPAEHTGDA